MKNRAKISILDTSRVQFAIL